jgi:peroxiredoxin (alkyl hydroperoxide reductase subunit C)
MILVTHQAPDFTTSVVTEKGELSSHFVFSEYTKGHPALVFFYPLDFTFVCPSELLALDQAMDEFNKRHIKVIAVSIDSQFTHAAWRNTPVHQGGIGRVRFTMAADVSHQICQMYGVEHYQNKVALRGAFLIDKKGIVRSQIINDLPIGRNIDEILRTFDALAHHEQFGEVCPANWAEGKKGMKASSEGVKEYLRETYLLES